jgi:hypothetical protein
VGRLTAPKILVLGTQLLDPRWVEQPDTGTLAPMRLTYRSPSSADDGPDGTGPR